MSETPAAKPASQRPPARDPGSPWALLALLALLGAHIGLVAYFFGDSLPLPEQPFNRGDFATHATQVRRVIQGLQGFDEHWVYDVQLLAGAPNGALFDADVKGWELWTYALVELGFAEGWAYNAYVLALHLGVPLVVYASARLFGLDRAAATTAAGLGVLLWFFDSFAHWMWFIGTVSYTLVSYFALLPLALFHRWLEDRRPIHALGCALALAFGHLTHPYIFFILVAPMLALYLRAAVVERSLSLAEHGLVLAIAGLTVVVNFWWLRTALHFFHYILDSAFFERGGVEFVFWDLFGLLHDSSSQGMIGPRTSIRLLAAIAAICALRAWRRSGDRRRLPLLMLIASMAALTYLGGYTPFAQIQPFRHNLPLGFSLLIPAGWWLREAMRDRPWRALAPSQRALALILGLLALLHVVRDLLYFFPASMRERQILEDGKEVLMNTLGHGYTPRYRYDEQNDWEDVLAWIREHDDGQGRWLIHDQVFGEYVMARTQAQVLGGFTVRNLEHSDANWFRRHGEPPYPPEKLREYCETYAVRWFVVRKQDLDPWWDKYPRLLNRVAFVDGWIIYQVHVKSRLLVGRGQVHAELNRIELRHTNPEQELLLRYHWMETLRCTPDCELERAELDEDRVGFIRVPAGHPRDFAIVNSYRWPSRSR
jgi:hypothetical protein